jgi:hypothetical protein
LTVTVSAGGANYAVGDMLNVDIQAGTATHQATIEVLTLSGSAVATAQIAEGGAYTVLPASPLTTTKITGGGDDNATFTFTSGAVGWTLKRQSQEAVSATVSAAGTGYSVSDVLSIEAFNTGFGTDGYITVQPTFTVLTVGGSGEVLTLTSSGAATLAGEVDDAPTNAAPTSVAPAGGSGCTLTVTYQDFPGNSRDMIFEGIGSGSDEVFMGIRSFVTGGANNWELAGMTGYSKNAAYESQPQISAGRHETPTDGSYVPLNNSTITYWLFANGRYLAGKFKMSSTYTNMYLAWGDPFATSSEYSYPTVVAGCSSKSDTLFSVGPTTYAFSGLCDPIGGDGDSVGPMQVRDQGGVWKTFQNSRQSGAGRVLQNDRVVLPCGEVDNNDIPVDDRMGTGGVTFADFVPNFTPESPSIRLLPAEDSGGNISVKWPTMLVEINPINGNIYMQLHNIFWVSKQRSTLLQSEDVLTEGNDRYIVFQNCNRTDIWNYLCIKRE